MKELIEFYTNKLQRKERLISDYMEEKNSIDGFKSSKREIEYNVLKSQIDLLKKFIEDLEDVVSMERDSSNEFIIFEDEMASIDNPEYLLDDEFINKMGELFIKQRKAPIKVGMTIQNFEDVIDEGHKFDTTEQTEYIKEIQKVSKFKLEK